ncbi:MAG: S8 family serine peptidase [Rhodopseudomonas palustris]|uniref:S8 family serine peptidase n=1 Tax=Rhodopseudomonas palustris TaxID=1076 RepID=A0A933W154_RHOPL|nr:S8 family serine peptidase [Rhodopseudomonas palustris]
MTTANQPDSFNNTPNPDANAGPPIAGQPPARPVEQPRAADPEPIPAVAAAAEKPAEHTIGPRPAQYMLAPRQQAGFQTLSANELVEQLSNNPGIEVVKTLHPPRLLGVQSDEFGRPPLGPVILAQMAPEKADLLKARAGASVTLEHDKRLTCMLDPTPPAIGMPRNGILVPLTEGFSATFEVVGEAGPLSGAEIYVFGSVWPTQGVTDASGRVTMRIPGESPDTIRALLIKPRIDYWTFWLERPRIVPDAVNRVGVKPLSTQLRDFPGKQMLGWGQQAMGLDRLPLIYNGAGVKIAVIDSGAAPTHRNLHNVNLGASMVGDDRMAWKIDTIGHGSHCTGIIAGGPVGSTSAGGIRGFAPAAEIHVCRIFPGGRFSDLVAALDYCMEQGIDVANMSLGGGDPSQVIEERILRAKQMGMACIVAAGNSAGPVQFPASSPHCLAVAALGKWGEFPEDSYHAKQALEGFQSRDGYFPAKFSCFGPEIDVCAPGVGIVSSLPADGFGAWDGTSMATPHVTGLAALVLAHHPDFKGTFQNRDARRVERLFQILKDTATELKFDDRNRSGAGLPNAMRALGLDDGVTKSRSVEPPDDLRRLFGLAQSDGLAVAEMAPQSPQLMSAPIVGVARGPAGTGALAAPPQRQPSGEEIRQILWSLGLRI